MFGARPRWVGAAIVLRSLRVRAGASLVLLLIAVIGAGAASAGPTYYQAARRSIVRDSFNSAPLVERGVEVTDQTGVAHSLAQVAQTFSTGLTESMPNAAQRRRLFAAPIMALEARAVLTGGTYLPVAWRTGFCSHLHLTTGTCPTQQGEVIVSATQAGVNHWHVGQRLTASGWPDFTITGEYAIPDFALDYWYGRGPIYFPAEDALAGVAAVTPYDAMFTPESTLDDATDQQQGEVVVDQLINVGNVRPNDIGPLDVALQALPAQVAAVSNGSTVTQVPALTAKIRTSWRALLVPIFLIVLQMALLILLVMLVVVGDDVASRGQQIALMRLRGRKGRRLFGISFGEPVVVLLAALPLGVVVGQAFCVLADHAVLQSGTQLRPSLLSWLAAAAATLGGLLAIVIAGWRTSRRGVVAQWQHASREGGRRGWVLDAIVGTAALSGVAEVFAAGHVTSTGKGWLALLVPGLLGLAIAIIASRLLPVGAKAGIRATSRSGGIGAYLALRHIGRRSQSVRTTILLATAFSLAAFSLVAWSTGRANRELVAQTGVGAPTVLTVVAPPGTDLGQLVDKLDPSGTHAVVVDSLTNSSANGQALLAVDPERFAHVATWRSSFSSTPLPKLMAELTPPVAAPVTVTGDQMRVTLDVTHLDRAGLAVNADLVSPLTTGAVYTNLGTINTKSGQAVLTANLSDCPCQIRDLTIALPTSAVTGGPILHGQVSIAGIDVRQGTAWVPVPLTGAGQWRVAPNTTGSLAAGPSNSTDWSFQLTSLVPASIDVADVPAALPALASIGAGLPHSDAPVTVNGLDENPITVQPFSYAAAIAGAPDGGLVVSRTYAERTANDYVGALVNVQVWITGDSAKAIAAGLTQAHVTILQTQTAAAQTRLFNRDGPGLASSAFVACAVAAAILAAGGVLMNLVSSNRRRRREYASLRAAGVGKGSLYRAVFAEQLVVLTYGTVIGTAAGILAADLAVRSVPEFVTTPVSPPLDYTPQVSVVIVFFAISLATLAVAALVSSRLALSGISIGELGREEQ